jgi:hypothetical protein
MATIKSPAEIISEVSPYYKKNKPGIELKMTYDSSSETLEPVYFWITDFLRGTLGLNVEKLIDNFASSVGSGHFSELMGKATRMQEESMKIYGMVNTVVKSIINIIYDLKEFKVRIAMYDATKSINEEEKSAAIRNLKQLWMDQVDVKKGAGSINMMAQQLNFVTLRDSFMYANSIEDAAKVDLNDRVKRVLEARVQEFLIWKNESELELKKRYELEKTYLRTQVETVKMYSRWAKPYLIAAEQLRMQGQGIDLSNPDVVNIFNTLYLQLTVLASRKFDVQSNSLGQGHVLPTSFQNMKMKREYFSCVLIDFTFRGIPKNVGQHYAFGGKIDITFKAYSLSAEELKLLKYKLNQSDFDNALKMISGMTNESLAQMNADISEILDDKKKKEAESKKKSQDVNPFMALLGFGGKKEEKEEEKPSEDPEVAARKKLDEEGKKLEKDKIKPDTYVEKLVRAQAQLGAMKSAFTVYDVYKKAHGMASQPIADYSSLFRPIDLKTNFTDIFKK